MEEAKELQEKQLEKEFGSFTKFPDLLLMDGGKGQVNVAKRNCWRSCILIYRCVRHGEG